MSRSRRPMGGSSTRTEYHEWQAYASGGSDGGGGRGGGGDFDLEREVRHMLPPRSSHGLQELNGYPSSTAGSSGLQSANMVSSLQQNQSYSSYSTQSSQHGVVPVDVYGGGRDGSTSQLKENIDELDSLLYDLNNVRKMSDVDYTSAGGGGGVGGGRIAYHSEQAYHVSSSSGKPPSPSHSRRTSAHQQPQPQPQPLSSPNSVRRASPQRHLVDVQSVGPHKYSYVREQHQQEQQVTSYTMSSYPEPMPAPPAPPPPPPPALPLTQPQTVERTPPTTGEIKYYSKYKSSTSSPAPLPQDTRTATFAHPSPPVPLETQSPPKRVTQLMTELSEFDSTIQDTRFVEPAEPPPPPRRRTEPSPEDARRPPYIYRESSPERSTATTTPLKQQKQLMAGPTVYYPPGEVFTSPYAEEGYSVSRSGKGKARAEYSYKAKEKSKSTEGESKEGAAVVPICLPLCCAAPCVIM